MAGTEARPTGTEARLNIFIGFFPKTENRKPFFKRQPEVLWEDSFYF